LANNS